MLGVAKLSIAMLSVTNRIFMVNVIFSIIMLCQKLALCAECHYAFCRYAECRGACWLLGQVL